jgi:tetratricopeptide (TPR) repeat protein
LACPTDETLALFAAGQLDSETRNAVLAHLETCKDCMSAILAANDHLAEEKTGSNWWIGAVAAAVIVALVIAVPMLRRRNDPVRTLVAAVPASERLVEPRLSGGFAWAPYRGPMRAAEPAMQAAQMKVAGAAADVIEGAQKDHSAKAERAAGVALMLVGNPTSAAGHLRTAGDWSDLAAADYAEAMQSGSAAPLSDALAAADRALATDPRSPEALFNRALILQHLGRTADARAAWQRYLEADPHSPWAGEARAHLAEIR